MTITSRSRGAFLMAPYGAYYHRDIPKEEEEITRVGPGTPCGEYLRRFWQPIAHSDELKDLPLRIRILGEDLVLFRDRSGRVGLLELHCSHRGTSLEFGQISQQGIRCCYHGWLFDVDGRILETPGEPPESTLKERLCHGAYPVHEYGGLVFAYMGPPARRPPFPTLDTFEHPGYVVRPMLKHFFRCNWLQVKDNAIDIVHLAFLHQIPGNVGFRLGVLAQVPEMDWIETPVGMLSVDTRRVGDNVWVKINDFIPPNAHQFPSANEDGTQVHKATMPQATRWTVPVDDINTVILSLAHVPEGEREKEPVLAFGQTDDRPYQERQRVPGDNDAQTSIHWGIARHRLEHLGATDRGVTMLRNLVRRGIRAVQRGEDPPPFSREPGKVWPTFSSNTVLSIPPASSPEEDRKLLRETGRRVVESYIDDPQGRLSYGHREAWPWE